MPKGSTLHFKSNASYKKWLAYGQIHHLFKKHDQKIMIAGKLHKVMHK